MNTEIAIKRSRIECWDNITEDKSALSWFTSVSTRRIEMSLPSSHKYIEMCTSVPKLTENSPEQSAD